MALDEVNGMEEDKEEERSINDKSWEEKEQETPLKSDISRDAQSIIGRDHNNDNPCA